MTLARLRSQKDSIIGAHTSHFYLHLYLLLYLYSCYFLQNSTSSLSVVVTPVPKRPSLLPVWGRKRCCSRIISRPWARCRAIPPSVASARAIWSRRSTPWAARWRLPPQTPG